MQVLRCNLNGDANASVVEVVDALEGEVDANGSLVVFAHHVVHVPDTGQ
jgi:hypothetical protein